MPLKEQSSIEYAFNILNKDKVVSFTATVNKPSQAVMERLGMRKVKYFNHPKLQMNMPYKACSL